MTRQNGRDYIKSFISSRFIEDIIVDQFNKRSYIYLSALIDHAVSFCDRKQASAQQQARRLTPSSLVTQHSQHEAIGRLFSS